MGLPASWTFIFLAARYIAAFLYARLWCSEFTMDGDGAGSSSGDVSSMAADEGPRSDPELPRPTASQLRRLYDRNMLLHRMQLNPNMEAPPDVVAFVFGPRDDGDADAGAYDDYGRFFVLGAVPASGVAMACLPETTVGEREGETGERGECCAVCLEEYAAGDAVRTMPCAHGFHERCIFPWLRASRLCPLCRFAMPAEEDDT